LIRLRIKDRRHFRKVIQLWPSLPASKNDCCVHLSDWPIFGKATASKVCLPAISFWMDVPYSLTSQNPATAESAISVLAAVPL